MKNEKNKYNEVISRAYHDVLLLEETKRKYSRTHASFRGRNAMEYIYEAAADGKGFRNQSDIADFLRITRPSCSVLIKKLESAGFVKRLKGSEDERETKVFLTRKGQLVTAMQCRRRNEVIDSILSEFSEEEQETIYAGFKRLTEVLESCAEAAEKAGKENRNETGKQ